MNGLEVKLKREEINWEEFNFREEVKTDRYAVEIQLAENPGLFGKYAEAWAEALLESDRADERVKLRIEDLKDKVVPMLDAKIRAEWGNLKDKDNNPLFAKAPSEAAISNWILLQPEYKTAQEELRRAREEKIEWNYIKERLYAGVKAFDNRMFSLGKLGDMLVKGIYSYATKGAVNATGREMTEREEGRQELEQSEQIGRTMSSRKPTPRRAIR